MFTRSDGVCTYQADIAEPAHAGAAGAFGNAVALSGDGATAMIGDVGVGQGAAWQFTRSNGAWTQQSPLLHPSDWLAHNAFGSDVASSSP